MKVALLLLFVAGLPLSASAIDQAAIEKLTGLKGALNEAEKVFKVSSPRSDLTVTVDEWKMPPFMGLTSWAAFMDGEKEPAMVMGDLVLLQDEVNPVMSALLDAGVEVTALHNHFFYDEPKVYFMHIGGEGTVEKLAAGVRGAFDKVKEIRAASPRPATSFGGGIPGPQSSITTAPLVALLGGKPQEKEGMVKFTFGRTAKMPCGCEVGKEMGVNTWAAFAGSDDNAVVDGDFVVLEGELQATLKSLRAAKINIVAIHHHMITESPRYVFLHYWGRGPALELAASVKKALELQPKK